MRWQRRVFESFSRLGSMFGVTCIPTWRLASHSRTSHLRKIFEAASIDWVLDVGANRGQFRDFVRDHVDYNGRVSSFEPNGHLAGQLRERGRRDAQWDIHEYAIGATREQRQLNLMATDTFSSLSLPRPTGTRIDSANVVVDRVDVEVRTLDDVVPELAPSSTRRTWFLKIDTQGHDAAVLTGSQYTLKNVAALQVELSLIPLYQDSEPMAASLERLKQLGFWPTALFPVVWDDCGRLMEVDCVAVACDPTCDGPDPVQSPEALSSMLSARSRP